MRVLTVLKEHESVRDAAVKPEIEVTPHLL